MKKNYFNRSQIKKISNTKLHFCVKFLSTVLLSLSLKHITRNGEIYCWWLAQLFRPLLKKRVFNQKWKKILLIIKQGTRAFWSLWAFHEIKSGFQRLLQSDAVVRRKKSGFYHVGLVFFRIFLMIFCLLNKEQSFNEIWILLIC